MQPRPGAGDADRRHRHVIPAVAGRLLTRLRGGAPSAAAPEALSARETAVLALITRGLTNGEVGRELFISEATVKTHLMRACGKLGVSGRTAAVARALQTGALPPPGAGR